MITLLIMSFFRHRTRRLPPHGTLTTITTEGTTTDTSAHRTEKEKEEEADTGTGTGTTTRTAGTTTGTTMAAAAAAATAATAATITRNALLQLHMPPLKLNRIRTRMAPLARQEGKNCRNDETLQPVILGNLVARAAHLFEEAKTGLSTVSNEIRSFLPPVSFYHIGRICPGWQKVT